MTATITPRESWRYGVLRLDRRQSRDRHERIEDARADALARADEEPGKTFAVFEEHCRARSAGASDA
jgi:hypothetical protein